MQFSSSMLAVTLAAMIVSGCETSGTSPSQGIVAASASRSLPRSVEPEAIEVSQDGTFVPAKAEAAAPKAPDEQEIALLQRVATEQRAQVERDAEAEREAGAEREARAERRAEAEREAEVERDAQAERKAKAEREARAERKAKAEREADAERKAQDYVDALHKSTLNTFDDECFEGDADSCRTLGKIYYSGMDELDIIADKKSSVRPYRKGCELGDGASCFWMSYMYSYGEGGLRKNESRSDRFMQEACDEDFEAACDVVEAVREVERDAERKLAERKRRAEKKRYSSRRSSRSPSYNSSYNSSGNTYSAPMPRIGTSRGYN